MLMYRSLCKGLPFAGSRLPEEGIRSMAVVPNRFVKRWPLPAVKSISGDRT